ncbi:hypothetical protein [Salidesulfovibrio brasiliensis]
MKRFSQAVLLLLALGLLAGCASKQEQIDVCQDMALLYDPTEDTADKENLRFHLGTCMSVVESYPSEPGPYIGHGLLLWKAGSKESACKDFKAAADRGDATAFKKHCNPDGSPIQ